MPGLFDDVLQPEKKPQVGLFDDVLEGASDVEALRATATANGVDDFTRSMIGTGPLPSAAPTPQAPSSLGDIALRAIGTRIPELVGNLIELPANAGDAFARAVGIDPEQSVAAMGLRKLLHGGADILREPAREAEEVGFGAPNVSGETLLESLNPYANANRLAEGNADTLSPGERIANVGRFALEQSVASAPDMAAAVATLPAYIGSRSNEIAEGRAANDQRQDPSLADLGIGAAAAIPESLLERFTTMRLLPHGTGAAVSPGILAALGRVAKETGLQGVLGGVEEVIPYAATNLGTEAGATPQDALVNFVGGLIGEGAMGATSQGAKEASSLFTAKPQTEPTTTNPSGPITPADIVPPEVTGGIGELLRRNMPATEPAPQAQRTPDEAFARPPPEQGQQAVETAAPAAQVPAAPSGSRTAGAELEVTEPAKAAPPAVEPVPPATQSAATDVASEGPAASAKPLPKVEPVAAASPDPAEDEKAELMEAIPERRGDMVEHQRLAELRAKRRDGAMDPQEQSELLDLTERDRVAAKVSGRRMRGVLNMEARNEAEASGTLKPVHAFADADNFKAVNDRLGHDVGDGVIRQMGELFSEQFGEGNVFHRGGDEFVMQADTPEQLDAAMRTVRERLAGATLRVTLADGEVIEQKGVGFSYGAGQNLQEAESAQFRDKEARKRAGLRFERDQASGAVPDASAVRGEPGEAREETDEGRTSPAGKTDKVTSTKNAVADRERADEGRDPIIREAARTNQETVDKAVQTLRDNPSRGAEIVERFRSQGVDGVSLDDEAILLVHKADLRNKRDAAASRAADESQSEEAKAVALREYVELEGQISAIDDATRASGREWGRLGQFRQRMLREDFTLEAMERRLRATTGKPLTPEQSAKVKELSEKVVALQRRADELQAKVGNVEAMTTYDDLLKSMQEALNGPRKRPTLERLRAAADESRSALAALESVPVRKRQSGAVINPVAFYHLSRIGAYHVANGVTKLADWTARMRSELGERFSEFRDMLPAVFQAATEQAKTKLAGGMSVDDVLAKVDPEKGPQPKDVRAMAEAHIRAGLRGEDFVVAAVAYSLDLDEVDARRLLIASAPKRAQTPDEVRAELRDLRAVLRIEQEISRLEAGEPKQAKGQKVEPSRAVAEKRAELEEVRKRLAAADSSLRASQREQLAAQREAERPDEETRYQARRGRDIQRRIQELQGRIDQGDFSKKPPRVPRALSAANEQAQFDLAKAKQEFLRLQFEAEMKNRSPLSKAFGAVGDTFNLARAIMTSLDLSGILRQGGFITYGHPVRAMQSVVPSLRAFASEKAEHRVKTEIEERTNAPLYQRYGLQLTGIGSGPLTQIEESYASRWLDRFPTWLGGGLVRGSGRSYTAFLNKLRTDSFDAMAATLGRSGTLTDAEGKAIANYINVATGRGKVGVKENAVQVLNTVFFAPRLVASRFQLLAGQPLYGGTPRTRKLIVQEYARFLVGVGVATSLAAFALGEDDDTDKPLIGFDPRSSDFGKVRIGDTYLDPLAGLAQVTVLLSRLATGETLSGGGKVKPLRPDWTFTDLRRALGEDDLPAHKMAKDGSLPFGAGSAADVMGRFMRTKLAPVPGAIVNTLTGSNVIGEEMTPLRSAQELVTPMSMQDISDVMEAHGVVKGAAIGLLSILGVGIQHRGEDEGKQARDALKSVDDAKADIEERLASIPVDRWVAEFDGMKKEYSPLLNGVEIDLYEKKGKYGDVGDPRMTSTGKPVLTFEGKDGVGSVMGELEGYPGFGKKGEYTTPGSRDRMRELDRVANVLGGEQPLTNAAAIRLTERIQLQVPEAQALFDAVQNDRSGDRPINRNTRNEILKQVRTLQKAEESASAEVVRAAKDGKPPKYNAVKSLVQQALDKEYSTP